MLLFFGVYVNMVLVYFIRGFDFIICGLFSRNFVCNIFFGICIKGD